MKKLLVIAVCVLGVIACDPPSEKGGDVNGTQDSTQVEMVQEDTL